MDRLFALFASKTAHIAGSPLTFLVCVAVVVAWAIAGPFFGFSETWQLVINTGTTIVTFLMVFLIQATQNRDAEAIQIKLDELILALDGARDELLDSEDLDEEEQLRLHRKYLALAERARGRLKTHVNELEAARGRNRRKADG